MICSKFIEYCIFGEGSQISTNQRQESTVFWTVTFTNIVSYTEAMKQVIALVEIFSSSSKTLILNKFVVFVVKT